MRREPWEGPKTSAVSKLKNLEYIEYTFGAQETMPWVALAKASSLRALIFAPWRLSKPESSREAQTTGEERKERLHLSKEVGELSPG